MTRRFLLALGVAAVVCSVSCVLAGEGSGKKKGPELTCPISGKAVSKTASADYKGGKVYFCCGGCVGKFKKETAKYATKANYQLVASGQAKQVACPISGRPANPEVSAKVVGVKVGFCCNGCKSKVTKAEADKQLELAFGSKAFEKGFKVKSKKDEQKEKS